MEGDKYCNRDNGHICRQSQPGEESSFGSTVVTSVGIVVVEQQGSEERGVGESVAR